jgi:hypothetical protein
MKVEVYSSDIGNCMTVIQKGSKNKALLEPDAILVREIQGVDRDDCMRQHHELMGWEPYVPFTD